MPYIIYKYENKIYCVEKISHVEILKHSLIYALKGENETYEIVSDEIGDKYGGPFGIYVKMNK